MALIIDLKPSERIIIGTALVTNDAARSSRLHIEGDAPILREKDIMRETEADSPCKKVYFMIQMMYLAHDPQPLHDAYFGLVRDIQHAAPSTALHFARINDFLLGSEYYKALKEARHLVDYERELIANAS